MTYVLTGTTDRKIYIWGRNSENEAGEATYIRANNVVVNGGIESYNQVKLVLEVPEGTDNTIAKVYAHDLKIYGAGTLHSNKLGVKQATSFLPSALHITDTKVIVNCPANYSGEWNGACVLDGNADVLYTACGDCAPLQIGVKLGDNTHSLTMKDSAKLRCLHAEGAVAHVTAPLLFVESKNKRHVFVKIKACATDFLENQKFSMDL